MDLELKEKRALVLGSSAGIGRAVAEALIAEGVKTVICARQTSRLLATAKEINAVAAIDIDLRKPGAGTQLVEKAIEELGGIDILVTNSGGPPKKNFMNTTLEEWKEGFQGLWLSAVESIHAALPKMSRQGYGRVILLSSVAAKEAGRSAVSSGLRGGLLMMTKGLSREVAPHDITVNSILSGFIQTDRLAEMNISDAQIHSEIPAKRVGDPAEVANLCCFLASPKSRYITGQAIACDGGLLRGI